VEEGGGRQASAPAVGSVKYRVGVDLPSFGQHQKMTEGVGSRVSCLQFFSHTLTSLTSNQQTQKLSAKKDLECLVILINTISYTY